MVLSFISVLSLLTAVAFAQPQNIPARTTRAITLVGDDIFLYGGSGSDGSCYSDLFTLHLDPTNGWIAADAPWANVNSDPDAPLLDQDSYALGSSDGSSLLFYGQTLCPTLQANGSNPPHQYTSTSSSVQYKNQGSSSTRTATTTDVLGPRLVTNDFPVPVQAVDEQNHMAYTFVYDAYNPNLGMQLWSFATTQLPNNIAQTKNTTMVTSVPPTPTNGTNSTTTAPAESVVLAPFMDPGNAVYLNGMIIVVGGGRQGVNMSGDNVDPFSGLYKTDRCFTYTIASGLWSVRTLTVAGGGDFPLSRRFAALVAVGNKIYMHGGNTTETVPTVTYEKDLWILDTDTWQWTKGPDSQNGRAYHTLINYQNTLISVSGFEFETTTTKSASNAFIMVYDLNASTWGPQFGTINKSFFQQHAIAIVAGSVSAFLVLVVVAAVISRLWRKHTGRKPIGSKLVRKFTNKPFLATTGARKSGPPNPTVAAAQLSGMSNPYPSQRGHETHIDLSALPRVNDSSTFDQHTSPTHQFDPYGSMQHVPLMADDALENQGHDLDPYRDGDGPEEKDMRPLSHATPHFVPSGVPETGSSSHLGQTVGTSGAPVAARRMTGDATDRGLISE